MAGFLVDRVARGSIGARRLADARLAVASLLLIILGLTLSPPGAAQDLGVPSVADVAGAPSAKSSVAAAAGLRVALIIANGAYPDAPLANPTIDSGLIADSLKRIGFAVTVKENLDLDGFEQAISDFAETAKGADLALFYFSGHGFSVASGGLQQNLLMATSANFKAKTTLALQQGGEPLEHVEETIIGHARATLIFIDACRNVPALATRGVGSRGFAPIDRSALEGAYVVLSTREGKTAADGEAGQGSPFARAFATVAPTPGLRIEDAYALIREKVRAATSGEQVPDVIRSDLPLGGVTLLEAHEAPLQPARAQHEAMLQPVPPTALVPPAAPAPEPTAPAQAPAASKAGGAIAMGPPPKVAANDPGGEAFKECEECPEMVVVPAGVAMLGSPLGESGRQTFEAAPHPVEIGKPFAVGRYAVTFAQWDACYAEGGCGHRRLGDLDFGRGNHPAIFATWAEAQLYVDWLRRKTGQPYRLLSESEWEFAARGCRTLKCAYAPFWFGAIKPELAVYDSRRSYDGSPKAAALLKTVPVDNGSPNPFWLYNMLGNVRQWTQDCWNPTPPASPSNGAPVLSGDCTARATRGGSWADDPAKLRASARDYESVDEGSERIGFRVARDLSP
jgi:formylglycine-generating enzyme required for sulfatase activity